MSSVSDICSSKLRSLLFVLVLLVAGTLFYFRMLPNIPMEDNFSFAFVNQANAPTVEEALKEPITNMGDVVRSVCTDYNAWSGRTLVDAAIQTVVSFCSIAAFRIINLAVFLFTIVLLILFTYSKKTRGAPLAWTLAIFTLFYLLPESQSLWYCPVYGGTYLWTMCVSLLFLLLWQSQKDKQVNSVLLVAYSLMGLIAGWQQETYSIAIAGMLVVHYAIRRFRMNRMELALVIPFLVGAALLVVAPGNFVRMAMVEAGDAGLLSRLFSRIYLLKSLRLSVVCGIILVVWAIAKRKSFVEFVRGNESVIEMWCVALAFILVANMGGRAVVGLELVSAVIVMRLLQNLIAKYDNLGTAVAATMLMLLVVHQSAIVAAQTREKQRYDNIIADYKASADGIVEDKTIVENDAWVVPFTTHWDMNVCDESASEKWRLGAIAIHYKQGGKKVICLSSADFEAISKPSQFFVEANKVAGNTGFHTTDSCRYFWAEIEPQGECTYQYDASDNENLSLMKRIKQSIKPQSVPLSELAGEPVVIATASGKKYYVLPKPNGRKMKELISSN